MMFVTDNAALLLQGDLRACLLINVFYRKVIRVVSSVI